MERMQVQRDGTAMREQATGASVFERSGRLLLVSAVLCLCVLGDVPSINAQVNANTPVFGPQTYTRTTGAPNQYTTTFTAPSWIVSPYDLHIVNGDANGKNRISSATIALNGVQIAGPSDFNQNVATLDFSVTLQASNTLQVTLASKPGSYLTINVAGTNGDHTPPQINIVTPANSGYINSATPSIEVTYSDPIGTGEPGASGANTSTFKATLDGVDRTSLFTVRSGDASATLPSNLALASGAHTLVVSLQDNAGNQATATSKFTVDLSPPQISIAQPVLGSYLNTTTLTISIQYSDSVGINTSTLKVLINGTDQTSLFTKTSAGATATLPAANALPQGGNQIVASIQNLAGTPASASTSFNIDTTPPTISFAHPTPNSYHGSSTVEIMVQYADDQALNTATLVVTLDGSAVSPTITPTSATAVASNVANGMHVLVATIQDMAGNSATAQETFYVDTTIPTIHVTQPAPNAIVATSTPQVSIEYSDIGGVDTTTLNVFLNGTNITSLFTITSSGATAQLTGTYSLPDGQNTITAQINNLAGIQGTATSTFLVDTTPPTILFQAPSSMTNSNTPTVTLSYSDTGSGVNPYSLVATVDGRDVSTLIAPGPTSATGVLQLNPPLSDGTHVLSATIMDRAGNKSQPATLSFVVDTTPPTVSFTTPANNSFINNPTPSIVLQYSDSGTGVVTSSIQVLLQQGTNPPADITSYFQIGPQQATGAIPAAVSLNDGTYVLSAVVNDLVGNSGSARATFVVDTVPPRSSIQAPAANAILNTSAVPVVLVYQDDRSGIDTSTIILTVDGVNQTGVLTITPAQATGTLPTLPDGLHTIQFTVSDRSGNPATPISQTFTIDTTPPTIMASVAPAPNSAGWNNTAVTVTFTCADSGSGVQTCPSPVAVSTEGAGQSICGQAVDEAGNTSAPACATANIDLTKPTITASVSPSPNANGIITSIPVTIAFTCSDALSGIAVCPSPISVTTTGLNQVFNGTAVDKAGNMSTTTVTVSIQTAAPTPPSITVSISPGPNSKGWENTPVTVTFACAPGSNPIAVCPSPVLVSTEGVNQSICGKASDTTGLSASVCATVNLDMTPPTITATPSPGPQSNSWNTTPVTVTFTCADSLSGVATCSPPQTISTDGFHQVLTGTAADNAGNTASTQITINLDQTPPSILQFTAPAQLAPGQTGTATVNATDNIGVASVVIQLNGSVVATLTSPPYTTTFTVPSTANAGDTLTLTAVAADLAGNVTSSARGIQVVPAGVVTGQVLSDTTGLPFTGATVQVLGSTAQDTSDNNGRYSIPSSSSHLFLSVSSTANATTGAVSTTTVEREVFLQMGVGTVPVDARLTQVAAAIPITSTGGSLVNGALTVSVAPGAVSSSTNFHLTTLSQQGLPGLLPLGWSPVAAFDLRADSVTTATFTAAFTQLPNSFAVHLVIYDYTSHSWLMVTPNLSAVNGSLTIPVPSVGDFALVIPDAGNGSLSVPSSGQPLTGVSMVTLPGNTTASGSLNPPSVSPTGGTASATLSVQSSVPLPSGTVIQAKVQDLYSLVSGAQLSTSARMEDIILYQFGAPLSSTGAATFPVTPSQTFQPGILSSGDVHLDILSGRESIRGQVGGSDAASVTGGDATLTVAAGSLSQDTAIAVAPEGLDTFLPSTSTLVPLAEYNIDLSGQTLLSPAQLSVGVGSAQAGSTLVLAQIQRIQDVPYLVVVSLAQVNGSNLITQAGPGFSGITQGGDYVFYQLNSPTGFVSGTVTASTGPVPALVQTDGLPFVAFASSAGSYVIVAAAGPVNLTASVPNTAVSGTASTQVTAGQTATANITVTGQTEAATVTPPNGAVGVPLTAEIDITTPDPLNEASVTATSVTLTQNAQGTGSSTLVPVRFVFTQGDTRLSVFPLTALQPSTTYTLSASGLATAVGGLVSVPTTTFTTQSITPPNFDPNALVFAMPDQSGNVAVTAPANSFPPGATVLIVDQTNGVVLSLTVANDGSVSGQMPATIDDILSITITAPDKTTATLTISKFVAPDGTTAIGPGGGTVVGPGNTGLIIPPGALLKGTTFKLMPLDQTAFPVLPSFPGMIFGSGLHVDAPAMPEFSQEVKVAFPVPPNAPSNAFYYVYRRLTDQNGNVYFDTIDHAFVQGTGPTAQVVTASPPFCGYHNSYGNLQKTASEVVNSLFAPFQDFILVLEIPTFDPNQPGVASQGLIVGKVLQTVSPQAGQVGTTFLPIGGATVSLDSDTSKVATTDAACGTFVLFDPQFGGGLRHVTVSYNGLKMLSTVNEINPVTDASAAQATFGPFSVTAGLESLYKDIGTVNFTFPPVNPPVEPQIGIRLFTLNQNGHRVPASGILQTSSNIVIAFQSKLTVQSASISGSQLAVVTPDSSDATDGQPEPYLLDARVKGTYPLATAGTYTITATAVDPLSLNQLTASQSFLVVASGGNGNTATITCTAAAPPAIPTSGCTLPKVIDSTPVNNATGVSPGILPQIIFNEPVTHVPGNVALADHTGAAVPVLLIGVRAPNPSNPSPIASPVQSSDIITSLTLQPLYGLNYNETYSLSLNAASTNGCVDSNGNPAPVLPTSTLIIDQNQPPTGPLCLEPFPKPSNPPYQFTTFGPQELGGTGQFSATRPVIIGKRAFLGERISSTIAGLGSVDITDPSNPVDKGIGSGASFVGFAMDASGQASSPVTNGPLVAIAAGQPGTQTILPSNVWFYDVSTPDTPARVAAVSATISSTQDGELLRIFMKDQFLYASTFLKGLQVIDMQQAVTDYQQTDPTTFGQSISTEGTGFATDAVVNTIPLFAKNYQNLPPEPDYTATMNDLKAADYVTAPPPAGSPQGTPGTTQTFIVATGRLPLVVADPTQSVSSAVLFPASVGTTASGQSSLDPSPLSFQVQNSTYTLQTGRALALGTLSRTDSQGNSTSEQVAVIVGSGSAPPLPDGTPASGVLVVVNMLSTGNSQNPIQPTVQGLMGLSASPTDVVMYGSQALVGTAANKILLVSLVDPTNPVPAGEIDAPPGNVFGDRLAISDFGILLTSSANGAIGGLHTATFIPGIFTKCAGPILAVRVSSASAPTPVYQTAQDSACSIQVIPSSTPVANGSFTFNNATGPGTTTPVNLQNDAATATVPSGQTVTGTTSIQVQSNAIDTRTGKPVQSFPQNVPLAVCQGLAIGPILANGDDVSAPPIIVNVKQPSVSLSATIQGKNCPNIQYSWDFGDGNTSPAATPSHSYPSKVKDYIVALTVNCTGCSTDQAQTTSFVLHVRETEFQVLYRAFIPTQVTPVPAPPFNYCTYQYGPDTINVGHGVVQPVAHTRLLFVQGDNRTFTPAMGPNLQQYGNGDTIDFSVTSRTGTYATVTTEVKDSTNGLEGNYQKIGTYSRNFAEDALYDGVLDPADFDYPNLNDCHLLNAETESTAAGNAVQVTRLGKHTIQVHLTGEARDALFPATFTADIEWDWTLTLDNLGPQTTYTLVGKQKAFPAQELFVNGQFIYEYDPSRFRSTVTIPTSGVYQDPSQPPIPPVQLPDFTAGLLQLINPLFNEPTMGPIGPAPLPISPEFQ
jgi:hypothetical protein